MKDEQVNVLDVVRLVDRLLAMQPAAVRPSQAAARAKADAVQPEAWLSCHDGLLTLATTKPVAALDILVGSCDAVTLTEQLEATGLNVVTRQQDGQTHLIAYSLSGQVLPEGQTVIGRMDGAQPRIIGAMLVDAACQPISLTVPMPTAIKSATTGADASAYDLHMGHNRGLRISRDGKKRPYRSNQ